MNRNSRGQLQHPDRTSESEESPRESAKDTAPTLNLPTVISEQDPEHEVRELAFRLYEERGRESGHDVEDWLKAEAIIRERGKAA